MKIKNTMISLVAVSALFTATACGGDGESGEKKDPEPTEQVGAMKVQKTTYNVLSGQRTTLSILTGDKYIDLTKGVSNYTYSVTDKGTATFADFDRDGYGILTYTNSGATDTITIKIEGGGKSSTETLIFNAIEEANVKADSILKTGQSEDDYGVQRDFLRDSTTKFAVKDNVNNLTWNDLATNTEVGRNVSYIQAKKECENRGLRLPTIEELYSTVLYKSDNFKNNMLDDVFKIRPAFSWADGESMMNYSLGYIAGSGIAEFRCVTGGNDVVEHVIMTDKVTADAYDLSTKLQWSKATETMIFSDAKEFCENKTNEWGHSGWKLPTINQLRSLVDNGTISGAVIGNKNNLLSSTKVEDQNMTFYLGIIPSDERTGYSISPFNDDQEVEITCVRRYEPSDIAQVK